MSPLYKEDLISCQLLYVSFLPQTGILSLSLPPPGPSFTFPGLPTTTTPVHYLPRDPPSPSRGHPPTSLPLLLHVLDHVWALTQARSMKTSLMNCQPNKTNFSFIFLPKKILSWCNICTTTAAFSTWNIHTGSRLTENSPDKLWQDIFSVVFLLI